ncbi:hypothetical protein ACS0TY_004748 [Phlomoides rotata]
MSKCKKSRREKRCFVFGLRLKFASPNFGLAWYLQIPNPNSVGCKRTGIKNLTSKLEPEKQEVFKKHVEGATKFLISKLKDFQFFVGESMHDNIN